MPGPFPGITLRVPSSHIDMFGHCNHARYLEYMEWARFAWAAHAEDPIPEMVKNGRGPAILRADLRYRRECLYDDELHVSVVPISARRDIGRLRQVITRTRDGGQSFETLRAGLPQQHCYDLIYRHGLAVGTDGRSLLMGSTTGSLWASGDAGDSWHTVSTHLPPVYALRFG